MGFKQIFQGSKHNQRILLYTGRGTGKHQNITDLLTHILSYSDVSR